MTQARVQLKFALIMMMAMTIQLASAQPTDTVNDYSNALATLRPGHPRAVVTPDNFPTVRAQNKVKNKLWPIAKSAMMATNSTIAFQRSTSVSYSPRYFADRMASVAGGYLVDSDPAKLSYALNDLMYISSLPAWGDAFTKVESYLDINNYLLAASWGYDWLYNDMTDDQRSTAWNAVLNNAFMPALNANMLPVLASLDTNVNVNSLTGFIVAAIVFAENDMTMCQQILSMSLPGIELTIRNLSPSGAFYEGPFYASYIGYNLPFALSAMKTGFGNDYGWSTAPALMAAAYFRIQCISPTGSSFAFADGGDVVNSMQLSYYAASAVSDAFVPAFEFNLKLTGLFFRLFWTDPTVFTQSPQPNPLPLDVRHVGWEVDTVFMRASWGEPKAGYLAVKGGWNPAPKEVNHAHLDLGSFVFDNDGQRWFVDLGYYRTRTESHNTLAISPSTQSELLCSNQALGVTASLTSPFSSPLRSHTVVNLTQAYGGAVSVMRGLALLKDVRAPRARLLVQDEVLFLYPVDMGDSQLQGLILSPPDAFFTTFSTDPSLIGRPQENPNAGVSNVVVRVPSARSNATIAVAFVNHGVVGVVFLLVLVGI
eukprot:jgi/Chlat1/9200/Chrsp97S09287